ncbi:MAG: hypothetical protein U0U70_17590 [Chitinophagaceae bacterium]
MKHRKPDYKLKAGTIYNVGVLQLIADEIHKHLKWVEKNGENGEHSKVSWLRKNK